MKGPHHARLCILMSQLEVGMDKRGTMRPERKTLCRARWNEGDRTGTHLFLGIGVALSDPQKYVTCPPASQNPPTGPQVLQQRRTTPFSAQPSPTRAHLACLLSAPARHHIYAVFTERRLHTLLSCVCQLVKLPVSYNEWPEYC